MYNYTSSVEKLKFEEEKSRAKKRQLKLYKLAERGVLKFEGMIVYKSEIKSLKNKGFEVLNIEEFPSKKSIYKVTISWEHAFGNAIPYLVYSYINRMIETFPYYYTKDSFAKELFVIAKRAQLSNL